MNIIIIITIIIADALWHRGPMASIASSMHPSMTAQTMKPEPSQAPYGNIMEGYFNHASQVRTKHVKRIVFNQNSRFKSFIFSVGLCLGMATETLAFPSKKREHDVSEPDLVVVKGLSSFMIPVFDTLTILFIMLVLGHYLSPVKRICVFEHSVMTNFNCACPAIQRGQGFGFLSEGSSSLTACMSEQRRFWRDCADAQARLNLRCSHRR